MEQEFKRDPALPKPVELQNTYRDKVEKIELPRVKVGDTLDIAKYPFRVIKVSRNFKKITVKAKPQ